jgi:hypothetical protein
LWVLIAIPFFLCTLEEYFLDTLDLPCINGVDEGSLLVAATFIFTAVVGQDFWMTNIHGNGFFRYNQIALYAALSLSSIYLFIRYIYDKIAFLKLYVHQRLTNLMRL